MNSTCFSLSIRQSLKARRRDFQINLNPYGIELTNFVVLLYWTL